MIRNYLKIAIRNLVKSRGHSFLNIVGLAIGMACCLLLFMYVFEELTFDRYHVDGERVFRVFEEINSTGGSRVYAPIAWPLAPALRERFPQVEAAARVYTFFADPLIRVGDRVFYEERYMFAEPNLFDVLTIPFKRGEPGRALERPNTIVITDRMANKYFGESDPMGQTLRVNSREFEITGILEDARTDTHLKYDFIVSFKTYEDENWMSNWHGTECYTYIKLRPDVEPALFEEQMMRVGFEYVGDLWNEWGSERLFKLQRVADIHLQSHLRYEIEPPGTLSMVMLVGGIGALVLVIACLNFVNLSTARSVDRAREVGMRKVVGGVRRELIVQFWGESLIMSLVSAMIALGFVILALPRYNLLTGMSLGLADVFQLSTLMGLIGIVAACGIGAGLYPAMVLSSHRPVTMLRRETSSGKQGSAARRTMVVFQFTISILLSVGTMIIFEQIDFMQQQYPGFEKEQKLIIPVRGGASIRENAESVKQAFRGHPAVTGASASMRVPGMTPSNYHIELVGEDDDRGQGMYHTYFDADFIPLYGIELIAGRTYDAQRVTDVSVDRQVGGFLINEAAAKALGMHDPEEALGKELRTGMGGRVGPVLGVTKDFHFKGMQTAVEPLVMEYFPRMFFMLTLAVDTDRLEPALSHIRAIWQSFFPDTPLEHSFLDADFDAQYRSEERLGSVAGTFTVMGLFIASLGLLGLAAYTAEQRTKEIGIRKTVGATASQIVVLLSREYARWVMLANVVAWPVAYLLMRRWLGQFAVETRIGIWPFFLSGTGALVIALLTVSYQSVKTARANPVDALRYE